MRPRRLLPGNLWEIDNDPNVKHGRRTRLKVVMLFTSIMTAALGLTVVCIWIIAAIEQMPMTPGR